MASAAEQRLFNYLNWLTFLLGILVGFSIVIFGVLFHDAAPTPLRAAPFASPQVEGPLMFLLFGTVMATQWWKQKVRAQLQAIWQSGKYKTPPASLHLLLMGGFFMSYGVFLLIDRAFDYDLDVIMVLLVVAWLAITFWAYWYTKRRGSRQTTQQP